MAGVVYTFPVEPVTTLFGPERVGTGNGLMVMVALLTIILEHKVVALVAVTVYVPAAV